MSENSTYTSDKESLLEILSEIKKGKIQLPDFQRGWVWKDDQIQNLIASITLSHPIGALMILQTGNPNVNFRPRPIEGVKLNGDTSPERLILDGQQRMTSLFQALRMNKPVETRDARDNKIQRWYYIDIQKSLDYPAVDREDAIFSVPEDRIVKNFRGETIADYSSTELECSNLAFPLWAALDQRATNNWFIQLTQAAGEDLPRRVELWHEFSSKILATITSYLIPLIILKKQTPKEAVCQVFEKVNTGGVTLTVFELLTATFASSDFNLRNDWARIQKEFKNNKKYATASRLLSDIKSSEFLQALTLYATYQKQIEAVKSGTPRDRAPGITCKRKDILKLNLDDYKTWSNEIIQGFIKAGRFLYSQKIFRSRDIPYQSQLIPLAAIFTALGDKADRIEAKEKIKRWYWCGVLGELYGGTIESRFAQDLPEVIEWISGGDEPRTVMDSNFTSHRLSTLRTRNSAAYKGIYALLMRDGCQDFVSGEAITDQTYFDDKIDIHHIFPRDWCISQSLDKDDWNSIINKTAISAKTNRSIGGSAPSVYLPKVAKRAGIHIDQLETILATHLIDIESLKADDFHAFFNQRKNALLDRIEQATGKSITRES